MSALRRYSWIAALVAVIAFGAGLALFAYAGTYVRYWADDYCYSAWVSHFGLFGAITDWYQTSGNRLSTLAVVALADLFGPRAIAFVPGSVLALSASAWAFALSRLARMMGWTVRPLWIAAAALMITYFTTLLAPDRLQTVYWRMGTLHYTLPVPLILLTLSLIARFLPPSQSGWGWAAAGAAMLAFFTAGLSETAGALQAGLYGLLLVAWIVLRGNGGYGWALFAAPLAGTLLMMIVQTQAPANAWRQAAMPPPDNLLLIVPVSLRYAFDFIFFALRGQIVPFAVYALAVGSLALLAWEHNPRISTRSAALGILSSLLIAYLLIVCSFAPSAYAGLQYPAGRAQMPGHAVLLAGIGAAAGFAALLLRSLFPRAESALRLAAVLILLGAAFYPLRALPLARADQERLSTWAERWDARDAEIRQSIAAGKMTQTVPQVEVVQSLEDLGPDPSYWVNACATLYYGAGSITAQPDVVR